MKIFGFTVYNLICRIMLHERNDDFMNIGNIENLKQYKHIHLIGIGGVSMSGIAEVLHNWGFTVTGSDCTKK